MQPPPPPLQPQMLKLSLRLPQKPLPKLRQKPPSRLLDKPKGVNNSVDLCF
jgi:hypothetical protein